MDGAQLVRFILVTLKREWKMERGEDGRMRGSKGVVIYLFSIVVVNNSRVTDNRRNRKVVIQLRMQTKQQQNNQLKHQNRYRIK